MVVVVFYSKMRIDLLSVQPRFLLTKEWKPETDADGYCPVPVTLHSVHCTKYRVYRQSLHFLKYCLRLINILQYICLRLITILKNIHSLTYVLDIVTSSNMSLTMSDPHIMN